jgi:hypothetical protein
MTLGSSGTAIREKGAKRFGSHLEAGQRINHQALSAWDTDAIWPQTIHLPRFRICSAWL